MTRMVKSRGVMTLACWREGGRERRDGGREGREGNDEIPINMEKQRHRTLFSSLPPYLKTNIEHNQLHQPPCVHQHTHLPLPPSLPPSLPPYLKTNIEHNQLYQPPCVHQNTHRGGLPPIEARDFSAQRAPDKLGGDGGEEGDAQDWREGGR